MLTRHGKLRIKERAGLGKSQSKMEKAAQMALDRGIRHGDTVGELRKYMDGQWLEYESGNNMRIYQEKLWVFHNERLITVHGLPGRLRHKCKKLSRVPPDCGDKERT